MEHARAARPDCGEMPAAVDDVIAYNVVILRRGIVRRPTWISLSGHQQR